jgi:hypothetical protein
MHSAEVPNAGLAPRFTSVAVGLSADEAIARWEKSTNEGGADER